MQMYDTDNIHRIILEMKDIKVSSFQSKDGRIDFGKVTETCRIVDTLILPLYYIWEHCCHRSLNEVDFEEHMEKPYQRFMHNPLKNTLELLLFVSMKKPYAVLLSKQNISNEITSLYKDFLDSQERQSVKGEA